MEENRPEEFFSILFAVIGAGGILFGLLAGYKNSKKKVKL